MSSSQAGAGDGDAPSAEGASGLPRKLLALSQWVELQAAGPHALALDGWALEAVADALGTASANDTEAPPWRSQWRFPPGARVPAGAPLLVVMPPARPQALRLPREVRGARRCGLDAWPSMFLSFRIALPLKPSWIADPQGRPQTSLAAASRPGFRADDEWDYVAPATGPPLAHHGEQKQEQEGGAGAFCPGEWDGQPEAGPGGAPTADRLGPFEEGEVRPKNVF